MYPWQASCGFGALRFGITVKSSSFPRPRYKHHRHIRSRLMSHVHTESQSKRKGLCTSLHIFAHLCTMFFHVFSCKQMQAVLNANAFFQGYPGYPCQDHQRHFAVQLRVASAGQLSLRGWRDAESSADDIIRHQLIKFDQISSESSDLNRSQLRSTRFCRVSYWRRSQWSFYPLQCRELRPWWWLAAPALTIRQHAVTEWNDSNRKMGNTAQSKTSCTPSFCTGYVNAFVYYCHALVAIYSDCCWWGHGWHLHWSQGGL